MDWTTSTSEHTSQDKGKITVVAPELINGLKVCVTPSPNSSVKVLTLTVIGFFSGGKRGKERLGHKGGSFISGISALMFRDPRAASFLSSTEDTAA